MVMQIKLLVVVVEFLTNPSSWVDIGSKDHVYSRWSNEQYSTQLCSWAATESIEHEWSHSFNFVFLFVLATGIVSSTLLSIELLKLIVVFNFATGL